VSASTSAAFQEAVDRLRADFESEVDTLFSRARAVIAQRAPEPSLVDSEFDRLVAAYNRYAAAMRALYSKHRVSLPKGKPRRGRPSKHPLMAAIDLAAGKHWVRLVEQIQIDTPKAVAGHLEALRKQPPDDTVLRPIQELVDVTGRVSREAIRRGLAEMLNCSPSAMEDLMFRPNRGRRE
jgi:hypothetical protein